MRCHHSSCLSYYSDASLTARLPLDRRALLDARQALIGADLLALGKSHLVTALGLRACECGHSVLFTSAIDAINTLGRDSEGEHLRCALAQEGR